MSAYNEQSHVAIGDLYTASMHNTLLDNVHALWTNAASGAMPYWSAANLIGALLKPTVQSLLTHDGTVPSWLNRAASLGILTTNNSNVLEWLTGGNAYNFLRKNSGNNALEWGTLASLLQAVAMVGSQAAEDLFVGASGTTIKRLAKGSNRDMLRVSGSGVLEYAPIGAWAEAKRTADLTGVSSSETTVSWDGAAGETSWKSSTRLTAPVAGDYELSANILFSTASVWRNYQSNLKINGVQISASKMWSESNYLFTGVHPERVMSLAAGDYLEATVDNCNGDVYAGSWMQMRRVR